MAGKSKKQTQRPAPNEDKNVALKHAIEAMEKQFGAGTIMRLGDQTKMEIETIPTGSIALDKALGVGGLPKGRIIEIYGPESSGKTTVALHCVAEAQKLGGTAAFIDAEHALDPAYAKAIGVDTENLLISQPDNGEQALEVCDALVRSGAVDIIVVDSVAALTPRAEIEGEMGDTHVGLLARLMSQALRKLTANIGRANTVVIFINQVREKIGVLYGNPETTTGGRALKFYSSVRLEVRRGEPIKKGTDIVGNRTKIKVVKNKVAPPFKTVEFDILYGEGISNESSIIELAADLGVLEKSGSWYSYKGERLGQGRENVRIYLREHPELAKEIEDRLRDSEGDMPSTETKEKELLEENMKDILDDDFLNDDDMDEL